MGNTVSRIVIIQGHPDPAGHRFGRALATAYMEGARAHGHQIRIVDVASLEFPLLRTKEDFDRGVPPSGLDDAGDAIRWANHVVIFFPLWLGTMPALLKGFFEQVFRPQSGNGDLSVALKDVLKGKSGRIVVTMGMPALVYRWYFHAHGVRGLEQNVLKFCGMGRIRESLIGMVEALRPEARQAWLQKMRNLGERAI